MKYNVPQLLATNTLDALLPKCSSREWSANSSSRERTLYSNLKGQAKCIRKIDLKNKL